MEVTNVIPGQPPGWCSVADDVTSSRQPILYYSVLNPARVLAVWPTSATLTPTAAVFATCLWAGRANIAPSPVPC